MEKGPSERIMYTMASECAAIAPSVTASERPQRRLVDTPKHHPSSGGIEREQGNGDDHGWIG